MKTTKYPDGTSYVTVPDYGVPNDFIFRINTYEDLWHLNQTVDAWNHAYNKRPTITIPNLIDAQADRRFGHNDSSGLKLVCNFLNGMNANFRIFHPHNPEVVEALMDNVTIIDNAGFIGYVLDSLDIPRGGNDNFTLMSSDAGGYKPLMKLCDTIGWESGTNSAVKSRMYDGKKTVIHQVIPTKDFEGRDILIVDDISVYGGTFKGLSKLLKERNCGKLYLAVSHMTVQNLGDDPVTECFDKVFTTNSKYDSYGTTGEHLARGMYRFDTPKNLEIIKLF